MRTAAEHVLDQAARAREAQDARFAAVRTRAALALGVAGVGGAILATSTDQRSWPSAVAGAAFVALVLVVAIVHLDRRWRAAPDIEAVVGRHRFDDTGRAGALEQDLALTHAHQWSKNEPRLRRATDLVALAWCLTGAVLAFLYLESVV